MQRPRSGILRLAILLAALAAVRCSKDDIPTTPNPPFIITDVAISKFVDPPATGGLTHSQTIKLRFDINYTLSAADDARRANLSVAAAAFRTDLDSVIAITSFVPAASGGTVHDSLTLTVPAALTEVQLDGAVLYTPLDTVVSFSYGPYWSVK